MAQGTIYGTFHKDGARALQMFRVRHPIAECPLFAHSGRWCRRQAVIRIGGGGHVGKVNVREKGPLKGPALRQLYPGNQNTSILPERAVQNQNVSGPPR